MARTYREIAIEDYSEIAIDDMVQSVRPEGSRVIRIGYGRGLSGSNRRVILSLAPFARCQMWTTENRPRYDRDKLRYPSDLTDEEWAWSSR